MAIIRIDGKAYEVDPRQNLLHACLSLGLDLPYFCWHPAMGSVGACRQCAVKVFRDENDRKGRIVMACMTPAADGTRLSIEDPEAKAFRASVIEWLMANHPHDCPVCDEGGECHLQDMTVMTGHVYRRYRFRKRTFRNQDLGPGLNHEMNRCIQCYRCVRFYRDYAGGRDFDAHSINHTVYFGRHRDGALENVFSGNLAEVCPTGVFTDKTHKRHYARKWDEEAAPSVCPHCGLGCNTNPAARYGLLRRVLNRYNAEINGFFLCDRGRFGYEYVNGGRRIRGPLVRDGRGEPLREGTEREAIGRVASLLAGGRRVIGIGSPRASLEANFALRALVGPDRFFSGMSEGDSRHVSLALGILREGPARAASIRDAEGADAALVLGEDVLQTAPRLALALRQAARQKPLERAARLKIPLWQDASVRDLLRGERGPLFIAAPDATGLDDAAMTVYRGAPDDIARLGFAVAHEVDPSAPAVEDLPDGERALATAVAAALKEAARPLVVTGWGLGAAAVESAANVAWALCRVGRPAAIALTAPECNSVGLGLMGGGALEEAFREAREGRVDAAIVLENDLYRRANPSAVDRFLGACGHLVVLDSLTGPTVEAADAVFPAAAVSEGDGTLVSSEGRAQRFFQVFIPGFEPFRDGIPDGGIRESWRWLRDIGRTAGGFAEGRWASLDEVTAELSEAIPSLKGAVAAAPPAGFREAGLKIPRQPPRYSGRTAMFADASIHEPKSPDDPDTPLSFSMEGYPGQPPPSLVPWFWAPSWNSIQATFRYQTETGGPLRGGPSGTRLLEPASPPKGPPYFGGVPEPFRPRAGEWLVVPLRHVFGSEELSSDAPAVAARSPGPYLALGPDDAAALGVAPGDEVDLGLEGMALRLPVAIRPALPRGVAGVPAGLPGIPWTGAFPRRARMSKVEP